MADIYKETLGEIYECERMQNDWNSKHEALEIEKERLDQELSDLGSAVWDKLRKIRRDMGYLRNRAEENNSEELKREIEELESAYNSLPWNND